MLYLSVTACFFQLLCLLLLLSRRSTEEKKPGAFCIVLNREISRATYSQVWGCTERAGSARSSIIVFPGQRIPFDVQVLTFPRTTFVRFQISRFPWFQLLIFAASWLVQSFSLLFVIVFSILLFAVFLNAPRLVVYMFHGKKRVCFLDFVLYWISEFFVRFLSQVKRFCVGSCFFWCVFVVS